MHETTPPPESQPKLSYCRTDKNQVKNKNLSIIFSVVIYYLKFGLHLILSTWNIKDFLVRLVGNQKDFGNRNGYKTAPFLFLSCMT